MKKKKNDELKMIEKKLRENFYNYPDGARIRAVAAVNDYIPKGDHGTVMGTDELGNIRTIWDANQCYIEFAFDETDKIRPLKKEDFVLDIKKFDFYNFISLLRAVYQREGLYIEGDSRKMNFPELEALITFTINSMLKDKKYFSYVLQLNPDGSFRAIDLGLFNTETKEIISLYEILPSQISNYFSAENTDRKILDYIMAHKAGIEYFLYVALKNF